MHIFSRSVILHNDCNNNNNSGKLKFIVKSDYLNFDKTKISEESLQSLDN